VSSEWGALMGKSDLYSISQIIIDKRDWERAVLQRREENYEKGPSRKGGSAYKGEVEGCGEEDSLLEKIG